MKHEGDLIGTARALGLVVGLALALSPAVTRAQARPAPPAPSCPPAPPPRPRAAIARVVDDLAKAVADARGSVLVVAAPLASDAVSPRAAELAVALAVQLAGRLGPSAKAAPTVMDLPAAREAAHAVTSLVIVTPSIAAGKLRAAVDVYPVPANVWARIRDPEPGPVTHAFADAPIDAEVRTFLAPVPLAAPTADRGRNFESDVVALACGDIDDDGALEIVSVSRRRVTTARLRDGKVTPLRSRAWPDLEGVAPAPLREPLAFATIVPFGAFAQLDVATTDRARSVRLDGALDLVASFPGLALPDAGGTACARLAGFAVAGQLAACASGDAAPSQPTLLGSYDAYAATELVDPSGKARRVWAGREGSAVTLRDDAGRRAVVDPAGAQVAIGDLDQDGRPELLASLDVMRAGDDAVVVRTWSAVDGSVVERGRIAAPAGVRAIAVCPPDGPGAAPFLVATADEIWIVRW